ncbi:MAG TPA: M15 family metallopeptidase [Hyphomonadaceae bacterium]|nr:M15 family metallopeptidase [Hyphomonadaceae bacterium]HPI48453.1 M15 family metallopeptidase [Hyphomonadaceae bacterium]
MRFGPALVVFSTALTACGLAACSGPPADPVVATAQSNVPQPGEPATVASYPDAAQPPSPEAAPVDNAAPPAEAAAEEPPAPSTSHVALKYLIGDVDPSKDPMFAKIPDKYLGGSRVWGHKDAVDAFVRMAEDAASNGYVLKAVSAFRSFSDQKEIWENKWTGKTLVGGKKLNVSTPDPKARAAKILEFSSMPATSRHHWGTDFDINNLNNSYFNTRDGKRIYDWLTQHAPQYGFCQVYSAKGADRPTGYEEEKWHWSYMPVASWYLKQYPIDVGYERIAGFEGASAAKDIDVIKNYVQGINPECR